MKLERRDRKPPTRSPVRLRHVQSGASYAAPSWDAAVAWMVALQRATREGKPDDKDG